jgi:hypothetical protein
MGYDLDSKVMFCERKKTGQLRERNQIFCPYQPDVMIYDGISNAADNDGFILAWYDDVKKKSYDKDEDSDDPYKTKKIDQDIEHRRRYHLLGTRLKKKVKGELYCCA